MKKVIVVFLACWVAFFVDGVQAHGLDTDKNAAVRPQPRDPRISQQEILALIGMDPVDVGYRTNPETHETAVLLFPSSGPIRGGERWYEGVAVPVGTLLDIPRTAKKEPYVYSVNGKTVEAFLVTLPVDVAAIIFACGNEHRPNDPMLMKMYYTDQSAEKHPASSEESTARNSREEIPLPAETTKKTTEPDEPCPAPVIKTKQATKVGRTDAVLNAEVDMPAILRFEVSTGDAEGTRITQSQYAEYEEFSIRVDGLKPGTKYYFRPIAGNDCGNATTGDTFSFTTLEKRKIWPWVVGGIGATVGVAVCVKFNVWPCGEKTPPLTGACPGGPPCGPGNDPQK